MPKTTASRLVIAYVPVLHQGYLKFFKKQAGTGKLWLIGKDLLASIDYLRKDLRALDPEEMASIIRASGWIKTVSVLKLADIAKHDQPNVRIIMPDEDISRAVGARFKRAAVSYHPVFLRWDRQAVENVDQSPAGGVISSDILDKELMLRAYEAGKRSSDIWRRVGALLAAPDGTILGEAANQGEPTANSPWMEGDPRNVFSRGVAIEMSLFTHAEAALIAEAAKNGTALLGAKLYVSTFPCPACAKLIARSGIKMLYYQHGYAILDGARVLQDYKVRIVQVLDKRTSPEKGPEWIPYNK